MLASLDVGQGVHKKASDEMFGEKLLLFAFQAESFNYLRQIFLFLMFLFNFEIQRWEVSQKRWIRKHWRSSTELGTSWQVRNFVTFTQLRRILFNFVTRFYKLPVLWFSGRDFQTDAPIDVPEQVDMLIKQATSHENLCQCYIGWWVALCQPNECVWLPHDSFSILKSCFVRCVSCFY